MGSAIFKWAEALATETNKFIVAWSIDGIQHHWQAFDDYDAAEEFLVTLPVARDVNYKFIAIPV